mmetsp:Transcript_48620/g.97006  ORF Transcript_48620/g.97006 Transcript_48620/m.97006 type:complete len:244 (+) Transcript_48620:226-957(+)
MAPAHVRCLSIPDAAVGCQPVCGAAQVRRPVRRPRPAPRCQRRAAPARPDSHPAIHAEYRPHQRSDGRDKGPRVPRVRAARPATIRPRLVPRQQAQHSALVDRLHLHMGALHDLVPGAPRAYKRRRFTAARGLGQVLLLRPAARHPRQATFTAGQCRCRGGRSARRCARGRRSASRRISDAASPKQSRSASRNVRRIRISCISVGVVGRRADATMAIALQTPPGLLLALRRFGVAALPLLPRE